MILRDTNNNNFYTMKKLFYLLMALPMLIVACNKETTPTPTPEPEINEASLTLTSASEMSFDAEGGEGTITFEYIAKNWDGVNNPSVTPTEELTIECEAAWIDAPSSVNIYAPAINFTVAENETEESREAVIKATIDELSFEVIVKQTAAEVGEEPTPGDEFVEGWAINGTMNNWAKKDATAMTEEGDFFVVKGFELAVEDNFNFIYNGSEMNRGGNGRAADPNFVYEAKSWGSNISVSVAGTYDIYLSADLEHYYIMTEGTNPAEAEQPLKPGEKRWSLYGDIKGYENQDITLESDTKYFSVKGVEFSGDMSFVIRCNNGEGGVYGATSTDVQAVETAIAVVLDGEEITVAAEEGKKYDIYFSYNETGASNLWVMPEGQYPVVWKLVSGGFMSGYQNFLCYFISQDIELVVDFSAGVAIENNVIPEGTYYVQDTENTGFCFDLPYCQAKVRGFETMLMDGTMTVAHKNGLYDIFIDMRTPQFDIIKMHWCGEFDYDPFFTNMGGSPINNPAN